MNEFAIGDFVIVTEQSPLWDKGTLMLVLTSKPNSKGEIHVWDVNEQEEYTINPGELRPAQSPAVLDAQRSAATALLGIATPVQLRAVIDALMDDSGNPYVLHADLVQRLLDLAPAPDAGNPGDFRPDAIVERLTDRIADLEQRVQKYREDYGAA